jgi:uncharacterized membrane protein
MALGRGRADCAASAGPLMSPAIIEWLNLVVRWFHVLVGIGWIGTSFFFIWLDAHLTPKRGASQHSVGEIWLFHSGGYYEVEKRRFVSVEVLPALHWFKWEAYLTWISGFALLVIVYYLGGGVYLVDRSVAELSQGTAVALGVGSLVVGWLAYDALWRSPLARSNLLASATSLALLVGVAYGLTHLLSGRAAYIHVGALLGTLMAANVWLVIQPAQRRMFAANRAGAVPDPSWGAKAKQRSVHNNYMTLPVIFAMISSHYPGTYGHPYNWAILIVLFLAGAGVRHFLNAYEGAGQAAGWVLAASLAAVIALAVVTASPPRRGAATSGAAGAGSVSFGQARVVFEERCLSCHSTHPKDDLFREPPNGVAFDTPEQIKRLADRIRVRVVDTRTMPLANKTGMTEDERALIGRWIAEGAPLD